MSWKEASGEFDQAAALYRQWRDRRARYWRRLLVFQVNGQYFPKEKLQRMLIDAEPAPTGGASSGKRAVAYVCGAT
jgi:hypothetical protein